MNDDDIIESFEYDIVRNSDGLFWEVSPLMMRKFIQRLKKNPSFINCFSENNNLTKDFCDEVSFKTTGERNVMMEIIGQTGSGKSIIALTIALNIMNKGVVVEDICFTPQALLKRAEVIGNEGKNNHTLIQDEQINQSGLGSLRESKEQETLEDTTRKFGLNIIFCSPTTRNHSTAHYQLEVLCRNTAKRITKLALIEDGLYYGYIVLPVIEENNPLWIEYNLEKDKFIQEIMSRQTKRLNIDDMSNELPKHKQYKYCKNKGDMMVVASKIFPTLTIQEHKQIIDNHILMKREKEEKQEDYLEDDEDEE